MAKHNVKKPVTWAYASFNVYQPYADAMFYIGYTEYNKKDLILQGRGLVF